LIEDGGEPYESLREFAVHAPLKKSVSSRRHMTVLLDAPYLVYAEPVGFVSFGLERHKYRPS
jgi:hypothetical protein